MSNNVVTKLCQVISVHDDTDGDRIKVRLVPEDDRYRDAELPYALPLLPKMLHIKPKVGEWVVVLLTNAGEGLSPRHYIGPIISQPQFMEEDSSALNALSMYPGKHKEPNVAPSTYADSQGALANDNDIAVYGRTKNDIIMTDDDIRIRSGVRLTEKDKIIFNGVDPAYIHLKHSNEERGNENDTYRSTATIVADKINLMGNKSKFPFDTNKDGLLNDTEMQKIIETAHQLPYGDILVEFLKIFIRAFVTHVHPYPGLPQCQTTDYLELTSYDVNSILSNSVRIN
jgi:hypothetical protein